MSKKTLAVELSKLKGFQNPKEEAEQYESDSNAIAEVLWHLNLREEIPENIADYGAGTGKLGIGLLILGKHVSFLEKDSEAIKILKQNLEGYENYDIKEMDVRFSAEAYDMIVMNPPFGTRNAGADTEFLQNAISNTNKILSIHLASTADYIKKFLRKNAFNIEFELISNFKLKKTLEHHKQANKTIKVVILYSKKPL